MATVKIKLSQSTVNQLAQLAGSTNNPEAGLASLFDTMVGLNQGLASETSYAPKWSATGNTATFSFGGGTKLTYTGTIHPSNSFSGTAVAYQRELTAPGTLKETIYGSMNYSYYLYSSGGINYQPSGTSTINSYKFESYKALSDTLGKVSIGLNGALSYTSSGGTIAGTVNKMTVGASKFLKSATIEGNLNVSGTLSSNADSVNSTVTGQLSGYKEQYYDGSFVDVSASVVYDGSALDESILANAAAWAGSDTFSIDLPANPGKTWQINTGTGSDTITAKGGGGFLRINTGADNDRIILGDSAPVVDGGSGTDTIESMVNYTLSTATNVENLVLSGKAAINGTGNATANEITGNGAANMIDGGLNTDITTGDVLRGGAGNDTYLVRQAADTVIEYANAGIDLVKSYISWALSDNVENLTLLGAESVNGVGNALANTLTANSGNNRLDGGAGADKLIGGLGDDTYVIDNLKDVITELSNGGNDTIETTLRTFSLAKLANVENVVFTGTGPTSLLGNTSANQLIGGASNDTLDGGVGNDTLTGGGGADVFRFTNSNSTDLITDFVSGTDKLSLSKAIFKAFAKTSGVINESQLSLNGQPQDANDFLAFDGVTGKLYYDADGNGGAVAVHIATLQGVSSISSNDILIG